MKKFALLFAILGLAVSTQVFAKTAVGDAAPDFSTVDTVGRSVKLSDLKDKIVVLEWNNPGCPFVHKHYDSGNMQALQKKYTGKGIVWITINSGAKGKEGYFATNEDAQKYVKEQNMVSTNYVLDPTGVIGKEYGASTTPHMFIINKGILVYQGAIDSIPSADKADIAKADNYVSKALDEILAGNPVTTSVTQPYGCSVKYGE